MKQNKLKEEYFTSNFSIFARNYIDSNISYIKEKMHSRKEQMEAFGRFLDILDELRVKCPWDRKQTNES